MLYNINDNLPLTLGEKLAEPQAVLPEWKETATPGLLMHRDTGLMKYSGGGHNQVTEAMCGRKRAPIPQTVSVKFSDVVVDKLLGSPRPAQAPQTTMPPKKGWYRTSGKLRPTPDDFVFDRYWNGAQWSRAVLQLDGRDTVNNKRFKRGSYAYNDDISWLPDTPPLNPHCAAENAANT